MEREAVAMVDRFRVVASALILTGAVALASLALPRPALADCAVGSDCFELLQDSGRPGDTITFVTTHLPDCEPVWITLYRGQLDVGFAGGAAPVKPGSAEAEYQFVVPRMRSGSWKLSLYCPSDAGPIGGFAVDATFRVIGGAPDTSTASTPGPARDVPPGLTCAILLLTSAVFVATLPGTRPTGFR